MFAGQRWNWLRQISILGMSLLISAGGVSDAWAQSDVEADQNWAQWRGPNGNGYSATADPPVEFSDTENLKWKVEVPGRGSSTPIIWDNQIFILTAVDTKRPAPAVEEPQEDRRESRRPQSAGNRPGSAAIEVPEEQVPVRPQRRRGMGSQKPSTFLDFMIISYDKDSGEQLWKTTLTTRVPHEGTHGTNNFASTSPITDGKHLFVNFGSRGVYCLDMKGEVIWSKDLGQMRTRNGFGEGASPALYEDTLVVPWDHEEQSAIIALDARTGDELWRAERDEPTTWATPLITELDGRVQVITNGGTVRSYDLSSGELIWEAGGQVSNPIPTPLRIDDNVICMTGYRGYAIVSTPLNSQGDVTEKSNWSSSDAAPYVPSPVLIDGVIYYNKGYAGFVGARDARTGEEVMELTRLPKVREVYASPVAAADRIYFVSRSGDVIVLKPGKQMNVLAENSMGEPIDASPAIIGKNMYLRGEKHLFCVQKP